MNPAGRSPEAWLSPRHPATLVAFLWTRYALWRVARDPDVARFDVVDPAAGVPAPDDAGHDDAGLPVAGDPGHVGVPPPPRLPEGAVRGVASALARTGATCLPRSLVRQAWESAHGRPRDLVIGVTAPSAGFRAHAWLAGDPEDDQDEFTELLRRPAP